MATLTQLEYLVAVDQHRHFGKAAKACSVSQPTLSMQLHKLEDEYGITFFDRSKQPILPTPAAEPIIAQAKTVLREMGKLDYLSKSQGKAPSGEFKLALIPTIAPYLLPLFLSAFARRFPDVQLSIQELTTEAVLDALQADRIDAAILATPLHIEKIIEKPLYYEPFWLYVSERHPLAKLDQVHEDKLDAKDVWLLAEGHCLRNQIVRVCANAGKPGVFPNVRFESGNLEAVIRLVEQGHGYTLLPYLVTRTLHGPRRKAMLKAFAKPVPSREVSLIFRRTQYKQPIINGLIEEIQGHLPDELPQARSRAIEVVEI